MAAVMPNNRVFDAEKGALGADNGKWYIADNMHFVPLILGYWKKIFCLFAKKLYFCKLNLRQYVAKNG